MEENYDPKTRKQKTESSLKMSAIALKTKRVLKIQNKRLFFNYYFYAKRTLRLKNKVLEHS